MTACITCCKAWRLSIKITGCLPLRMGSTAHSPRRRRREGCGGIEGGGEDRGARWKPSGNLGSKIAQDAILVLIVLLLADQAVVKHSLEFYQPLVHRTLVAAARWARSVVVGAVAAAPRLLASLTLPRTVGDSFLEQVDIRHLGAAPGFFVALIGCAHADETVSAVTQPRNKPVVVLHLRHIVVGHQLHVVAAHGENKPLHFGARAAEAARTRSHELRAVAASEAEGRRRHVARAATPELQREHGKRHGGKTPRVVRHVLTVAGRVDLPGV
mmetsp:Transcript_44135/g.73252  ORF Transcript_44135/g.73252 Transcript_44135/m.73252 type:complete len:271 (-) Transcript_44135:822-1634(-)